MSPCPQVVTCSFVSIPAPPADTEVPPPCPVSPCVPPKPPPPGTPVAPGARARRAPERAHRRGAPPLPSAGERRGCSPRNGPRTRPQRPHNPGTRPQRPHKPRPPPETCVPIPLCPCPHGFPIPAGPHPSVSLSPSVPSPPVSQSPCPQPYRSLCVPLPLCPHICMSPFTYVTFPMGPHPVSPSLQVPSLCLHPHVPIPLSPTLKMPIPMSPSLCPHSHVPIPMSPYLQDPIPMSPSPQVPTTPSREGLTPSHPCMGKGHPHNPPQGGLRVAGEVTAPRAVPSRATTAL